MNYKLAIFDLDGTLLNTLDDIANSVNYALSEFSLPARTVEEVRSFVGNGIKLLIKRAVPENSCDEMIENVLNAFKEHYKKHMSDNTKPYDGICEILKTLRESDRKVAILSNKVDDAVKSLSHEYFEGLYDIAIGQRENIKVKPAPDALYEILKELCVSSNQAVFIGDSEVDIDTARNADMDCISVDWGFKDKDFLINYGASRVVSSSKELLECIF